VISPRAKVRVCESSGNQCEAAGGSLAPFAIVSLKRQYVASGTRNATMVMLRLSAGIATMLSFEADMHSSAVLRWIC
jgi:hypothetical protein